MPDRICYKLDPSALITGTQLTLEHEVEHEAEIALGKQLLRFADVVHEAGKGAVPHLVCEHLYGLARVFSGFYEQCSVLKAEGESRRTRLLLCWLTARGLERGLGLLGIDAPDRT
jgi:arginyl-tRNA synthetase